MSEPLLTSGVNKILFVRKEFVGQELTDELVDELKRYVGSDWKEIAIIEVAISLAYRRGFKDAISRANSEERKSK